MDDLGVPLPLVGAFETEGAELGDGEGSEEGASLGDSDGSELGASEGSALGLELGDFDGSELGALESDGAMLGPALGAHVGSPADLADLQDLGSNGSTFFLPLRSRSRPALAYCSRRTSSSLYPR